MLITGGSTGIGKEVVELLAKRTANIAVLDLAPPTYDASEFGIEVYRVWADPPMVPQSMHATTNVT